jgi:acyl-CoA thioesterase YciA
MNDEQQNSQANRGELSTRTMAMPADTNPSGDIFGGWLLAQMDIAGGIFAHHIAGGRVVTIALEAMSFHLPVYVGDEVSCYCSLAKQGNSSMSVKVETWVRRRDMPEEVKVTEGCFTFVAVDEQGKPRKISN